MAELSTLISYIVVIEIENLHVLANGPPDVNGYAIRTHG